MAKSLALVDRHNVEAAIKEGLHYTWTTVLEKDNGVTLFRAEDWKAWVTFTVVFLVLIIFDNVILNRNPKALTMARATIYTLFWVCMAFAFCGWVSWNFNQAAAYMWMSGYMLEWMLSFDNLFVFHMIFSVYGCPDNLKHRPLYLGIVGAVIFRLVFLFIGEYLMHAMFFMHLVFGSFLVYTGIQTIVADEEDEDPSQNTAVLWLKAHIPFVNVYDSQAHFFVKCPVKENGDADIPESAIIVQEPTETDRLVEEDGEEKTKVQVVDFASLPSNGRPMETRATMLFLVVCCLEISDILFAVDSVSAIVAQVPDLFLAYTSAVFAMLGLRATFFIIDVLVDMFSLLKYGVGMVLVFIGIKLIIGKYYHVPASVVCIILVGSIAGSMLASVIKDKLEQKYEGKMSPEMTERLAKIKGSPFASPAPVKKMPVTA